MAEARAFHKISEFSYAYEKKQCLSAERTRTTASLESDNIMSENIVELIAR